MPKIIDLTGHIYNEWTVIEFSHIGKHRKALWLCKCSCGEYAKIIGNNLRRDISKRCKSCSVKKISEEKNDSKNPMYSVWRNMKKRCLNRKNRAYPRYGGRGITICDSWRNSFKNFYNDMKEGYKKGLEIDRRDNDGNYEPGNCRWATRLENVRNSTTTKLNPESVKVIKYFIMKGRAAKEIAAVYGVGLTVISDIKLGKSWADVKI